MEFSFRIHAKRADGTPNRRFHKVRYTAALRFGIVLPEPRGFVELSFSGQRCGDVVAHGENLAYEGRLSLNGRDFAEVVVIAKHRDPGTVDLITFWPRSQHPDAHQSYTDPLVDTAMDGTPFDIEVVATRMHAAFCENAGASPATLMKNVYDEETGLLRDRALRLADLLEESFSREQETRSARDAERAGREQAEAERDAAQAEVERLRSGAYIAPPPGAAVDSSKPTTLVRVSEGRRGKSNQRAVLLHMSDGTVRANNWERSFEARFEYAKKLEGRPVRTDVWGGYSPRDWFKNIYPA